MMAGNQIEAAFVLCGVDFVNMHLVASYHFVFAGLL